MHCLSIVANFIVVADIVAAAVVVADIVAAVIVVVTTDTIFIVEFAIVAAALLEVFAF